MSKLNLTEFRDIKNKMLRLIESAEQESSSEKYDDDEAQKIIEEYRSLQDKLLSYDLSDIPFEEWQGLYLVTDGQLDLSNTHANIDFSLLAGMNYDSINFNGCNVRGIQAIEYDESMFSPEFIKAHPEYFPDESVPADVRQLFYDQKLAFSDLIKYPALRKCINENSFKRAYPSGSYELIKTIGFENAIKFFDEYPNFVSEITYEKERGSYSASEFNFRTEKPFDKNLSYEEAKQFIYSQVINEVKRSYFLKFPSIDIIPKEMITAFPNVFIYENELPQEVIKNYYDGNLSVYEIKHYAEVLKNKDLEIGTHSSSEIRAINKIFGNVWNFIEQVPDQYYNIVTRYLEKNTYDDEKIEAIAKNSTTQIITDSIRNALDGDDWTRGYYTLDELYDFSQYVSIDEIFWEDSVVLFIKKCGFKNIVEFNKKHNRILESGETFSSVKLLQEMAKYSQTISEDVTNEQQLIDLFGEIIHKMRFSDDFHQKSALSQNKIELSTIYPNEFIDYNLLYKLLQNFEQRDKERFISELEDGFNGKTKELLKLLNKNQFLLPVLLNKNLIIDKTWNLKSFYDHVGNQKFLEIGSKYGIGLVQTLHFINDESAMLDFISKISGEDYEQQMNEYIYNSFSSGTRTFDIRILPPSFREKYPELFLDENAPRDLQDSFYGEEFSYSDTYVLDPAKIKSHPEWIPFLMKVDLGKCLKNKIIDVYKIDEQNINIYSYNKQMNFYEALGMKFNQLEILEFISKYGNFLEYLNLKINISLEKQEIYNNMIQSIYELIKKRQFFYDRNTMPKEFVEKYPEMFLDEDVPEELKNLFYQRKINPAIIQNHKEWKKFLQGKNIGVFCDTNVSLFVRKCEKLGFDNNKIFELFEKYGQYLAECQVNIDDLSISNIGELDNIIKQQIIESIILKRTRYNEDANMIIGLEHPELFLDESAPKELKEVFYNYTYNTPLTFELLSKHREWLPYLDGKNVLLSLKKRNIGNFGLEQLFIKYGDEVAIKIGMKNPESVMKMLSENRFDTLALWYDKLHFIPHHVVMKEFPFEQSDKFVASGKKWSQLMRIERHNINEDSKAALLKASMCFGVFDDDMEGFNKTIQLFCDIPKTLSVLDMQKMKKSIQEKIDSLVDNPDPKMLEEYKKQLELIDESYTQGEDKYTLKINSQQNKELTQLLRSIMEDNGVSIILTPDKAHKLFGGFEMKYDPDFRDFILKNMDIILSSDEYIAYISSMQKQWAEIKAINSNRVLTLDLAMAFVKSNNYENIQVGNEKLAEVSAIAGYDQKSFETLQEIYNYGKSRTFSSIPRIHVKSGEYTYEILRLDDPLAVAIGTLTDCCQELGNAAETSMEHSMVDKNGRIFVIKDESGNIVAQSWVWRNKNVLCFDNIEIPAKAFTRAERGGSSRLEFTDTVFALYKQAGEELIAKDEAEFKKLLEEGKITEEQYEALKLGKITVGTGYNDIADSLRRNAKQDESKVARPLEFIPPVDLNHSLYIADSSTQYVIAGDEDVVSSDYETPTIYSDEFLVHDNSNTKQQDSLLLQKLELTTKGDNYTGRTQSDEEKEIVSDIAYNYGLNPETTRIVMNANFAIIYDTTQEEIIVGDILYNTKFNNEEKQIDITDKVIMQIRIAINQICKEGKKLNVNRLNPEQLEIYNKAMNLDLEIDEERGLTHGTK